MLSILSWFAAIWFGLGLLAAVMCLRPGVFQGRTLKDLWPIGAAVVSGPLALACVILLLWEEAQDLRKLRAQWEENRQK